MHRMRAAVTVSLSAPPCLLSSLPPSVSSRPSYLLVSTRLGSVRLACLTVATGFENHLARPILREEWHRNLSFEDGVKLLEKCMHVLLYRDRSAVNKLQTTEEENDDAIRIPAEAEKRCEAIADPSCDLAGPSHGQVEESYMICTDSGSFFEQKETTFSCGCNLEKLEESCIFVDGDELQFLALNKGGKQRHHKKTLQEAFSSRKRSSRAQEYKQFAVKYSDESNEEERTSRF